MSPPQETDRPRALDRARVTVLAVVVDDPTRALLQTVLAAERLVVTPDPVKALALAKSEPPDVVFVDITIGGGAGLAMVHHMKAVTPDATVLAMASKADLEAGANAVALGGAGLLVLPLAGDEVMNAVGAVRAQKAEKAFRAELEQQILMSARAAGWIGRMAELAAVESRVDAAARMAEVLSEATGAAHAVVYFATDSGRGDFARVASSAEPVETPALCTEAELLDLARREQWLDVPLAMNAVTMGHILLLHPEDAGPGSTRAVDAAPASSVRRSALRDGLLKLLATQASAALALLRERELLRSMSPIQDRTTSTYSFGFFADIATRELHRAARFGRRLSLVAVVLEPTSDEVRRAAGQEAVTAALVADRLVKAAPDLAVVGHVGPNEFHVLLPESDALAAQIYRRRALAKLGEALESPARLAPREVLAGTATFPHDGESLRKLTALAAKRAEATRVSVMHRCRAGREVQDLLDLIDADETDAPKTTPHSSVDAAELLGIAACRRLHVSTAEAAGLASIATADALRAGSTVLAVTYRPAPNLFAAVRASLKPGRTNLTFRAFDLRSVPGLEDLETLCVVAEHGSYALIGRVQGSVLRGLHAADPLLTDVLLERLGRAAGLQPFS